MADRYMVLVRGNSAEWANLSPDDLQHVMERYNAWTSELRQAGHEVLNADALQQSASARLSREGDIVSVEDGPYAETKESVGGYWVFTAASRDDAIAAAKSCPALLHGWTAELIPIDENPG